jgi:hypothetical protein
VGYVYVMYYFAVITFVMMPHDDPGETNHPCLRAECHNWYQSITDVIHRVRPIFKNRGEDALRCPHKDYSSLNRWQTNLVLLFAFALCNLLFCNDAPTRR